MCPEAGAFRFGVSVFVGLDCEVLFSADEFYGMAVHDWIFDCHKFCIGVKASDEEFGCFVHFLPTFSTLMQPLDA